MAKIPKVNLTLSTYVVKSAENNIPIVDILNLVQGKLTPESGSVLLG